MKHKKKKVILSFTAVVVFAGFIGMFALSSRYGRTDKASDGASDSKIELEESEHDNLVNSSNVFDFAGTKLLKKDAYPEVNELVKNYYQAMLSFDMETMEGLVSDINNVDQNLIRAKLQYMENISNIICYTVDGDVSGTFRTYVYYDLKIRGIDTLAPALSAMYITMSSDGNYVIYLGELDGDTQDFIDEADSSQDVLLLSSLVSDRLKNVVETDDNMKTFYDMMNAAVNSEATADPNVQTADPNVQAVDPNAQPADPNVQAVDPNAQPADPNVQTADPNAQPVQ